MTSDRNSKLRNYAARKTAERREQGNSQGNANGDASSSSSQRGGESGEAGVVKPNGDQKMRQRSLLRPSGGMVKMSLSPQRRRNRGYGSPVRSALPSTLPSVHPSPPRSSSNKSSSHSSYAYGAGRRVSGGGAGGVRARSEVGPSSSGGGGGGGMTSAQKAAFLASQRQHRRKSGGVAGGATTATSNGGISSGGKGDEAAGGGGTGSGGNQAKKFNSGFHAFRATAAAAAAAGGGGGDADAGAAGKAHSTIGLPSLDNRDKMKRLFAARRRKAQMEMTVAPASSSSAVNTSVASVASVESAGSEDGNKTADKKGGAYRRESDGSVATAITIGSVNTAESSKPSSSSFSSRPSFSAASSGDWVSASSYSSRRALDRYLGGSRRGSMSSAASASIAPLASVASVSSAASVSSITGSNISRTGSSDSADSHTVGSLASRGTAATGTLPPVKEESASSLVTTLTDNAKTGSKDGGAGSGSGDVASSSSASTTAAYARSRGAPWTKDTRNADGLDDAADENEKSVRFRLSHSERRKALEKEERERKEEKERKEREAQCSPPRRPRSRKEDGAQCSPPRPYGDRGNKNKSRNGGGAKEEEEDMEFAVFVAGLKREVAGEHVELWSGLQSLLGCPLSSQVPLHESYVDENVQEVDRSGKKKKKKKVKMDPQTQKSLTTIHKHLMENGKVKGKFMTSTSQLVNDKRVKKDRAAESGRMSMSSMSLSSSSLQSARRHHGLGRTERSAHRDATTCDPNNVVESNVNQQHAFKQLQNTKARLGPSAAASNNNAASAEAKFVGVKLRSVSRSNGGSNGSSLSTSRAPASATKPKLSWMEALKKKKKDLRLKQMSVVDKQEDDGDGAGPLTPLLQEKGNSRSDDDGNNGNGFLGDSNYDAGARSHDGNILRNDSNHDSNDNNNNVGMGGVVLRRVIASPRKKPRITPPSTPEVQAPPWASLQLRSTPKKRESMTPTLTPTKASARVANGTLPPIETNGSWGGCSSPSRNIFAMTPVHGINAEDAPSMPPLCYVGDIIDLDDPPQKIFPSEEGPAAIFSLKQKEAERAGGVVIVGKTAIVTASVVASTTASSKWGKASISWSCRRSEVRAMTLNVEATGANLAHAHGRTPLLFESADVCLDFAQAFYGRPGGGGNAEDAASSSQRPAAAAVPLAEKKQESNTGRDQKGGGMTTSGQDRAKSNLTEDEESLLDRYRQFSHSDRTKLRLTCLSPRGEEEVEVALSPPAKAAAPMNQLLKDVVQHAAGKSSETKSNDSAAGGQLSEDEEKVASKYRKMLKMGIPPDAVGHKMTSDNVPSKIASAVLGGNENEQQSKEGGEGSDGNKGKLSEKEEALANKFRKMMKMKIPAEAVRHKMTMEGVDAKIVEAVFNEDSASSTQEPKAAVLSSAEEVIASKYRRMLKMGVPFDGVEHKMKQDGIDMKIISVLVNETSPHSNDAEKKAAKPSTSKKNSTKSAAAAPSLSKEEEATASKYRNMLKVCIPKDAVRHKMKQEGVSAKIMEAVLGKEQAEEKEAQSATNARPSHSARKSSVNNRKTIALHWTASNLAPELLEQSIFGRRDELKKRKLASINPEEADIKKLEELFQKRNNAKAKGGGAAGGKGGGGKDEAGSDMAKLLDLTRANNIAISLKAFNDFSFRSLAETINDVDPDRKIVGERVQFIPNLLPTPKEMQAIKKYKGEDDKLITAELFFRQLVPMKRIEDKVRVMRTMSSLEEHASEARAGFQKLKQVCTEIMNSDRLIQVLEMVLNIGNLMNAGSVDGGVEAFKFESLPRLSQTKSADGRTTVLDYIVETFIEKGQRGALMLTGEFPDIQDASRLSIGDLIGDMNALRKDYKLCKTELASMKRDQSSKRVTRSMSKKIKEDGGGASDPKNALFAAIKSRGDGDPPKPAEGGDPMQALLGAIKSRNKGSSTADADEDSKPSSDVKYSPGVQRLQEFLTHSKTILMLADKDQDSAIRACKGLAVYCGEEGGERSAAPLLQVLSDFALSLENGVKKYDERVAAEKRREAKKKKDAERRSKSVKVTVEKDAVETSVGKFEKEKEKENSISQLARRNGVVAHTSSSPKKLLKESSLQPQVRVAKERVHKISAASQGKDPMSAILDAIKDKAPPHKVDDGDSTANGSRNEKSRDPQKALHASIKNTGDRNLPIPSASREGSNRGGHANSAPDNTPGRMNRKSCDDPNEALRGPIKNRGDRGLPEQPSSRRKNINCSDEPKDALLESIKSLHSIKNRGDSSLSKPPASGGVSERDVRTNGAPRGEESRILLVNRMLSEAPANVKQDFLKGVTYRETADPLLRKIYEKEGEKGKGDGGRAVERSRKPAGPRTDLFAEIRNRKAPS